MWVIPALTPYQARGRLRGPVFPQIPAFQAMTDSGGIHFASDKHGRKGFEKVWGKNFKVTFYVTYIMENGKFIPTWLIIRKKFSIFPIISVIKKKLKKKFLAE